MEYTETQKDFIIRKYGSAYLSAKAKIEAINELGKEAYNKDDLKPEYQLTHDEKAVLNMPKELFEDLEEEKGKSL